jgi:hypothetical protein
MPGARVWHRIPSAEDRVGKIWIRGAVGFLLLGLGVLACGSKSPTQLLVVYSGDGQGYLEPCG